MEPGPKALGVGRRTAGDMPAGVTFVQTPGGHVPASMQGSGGSGPVSRGSPSGKDAASWTDASASGRPPPTTPASCPGSALGSGDAPQPRSNERRIVEPDARGECIMALAPRDANAAPCKSLGYSRVRSRHPRGTEHTIAGWSYPLTRLVRTGATLTERDPVG